MRVGGGREGQREGAREGRDGIETEKVWKEEGRRECMRE